MVRTQNILAAQGWTPGIGVSAMSANGGLTVQVAASTSVPVHTQPP